MWPRTAPAVMVPLLAATAVAQQPPFAPPHFAQNQICFGVNLCLADLDGDGRKDVVAPRNSLSLGPAICSFYSLLLDDDGGDHGFVASAPPAGPYSMNGTARVAAADFDGDGRDDVAALTDAGALCVLLNRDHNHHRSGFTTADLIENTALRYPCTFPAIMLRPVFLAADLDADGHQDLLFAGNIANYYTGAVNSTGLNVWFGQGNGSFDPVQVFHTQSRAPAIDVKWIDWDGDGRAETLMVLGETHATPYALTHSLDLCRLPTGTRTLSQFAPTQTVALPATRAASGTLPTAIDFAPAEGQLPRRFVLCGYATMQAVNSPEIWIAVAQANGSLSAVGFQPVSLPLAGFAAASSELQAVRVGDIDGDGQCDAVAFHPQGYASSGPQVPAEILCVRGPLVPGSVMAIDCVPLAGTFGTLQNATNMVGTVPAWIPNTTTPDALRLESITGASLPDVVVSGIRMVDPTNPSTWISAVAVLRNQLTGTIGGIQSVSDCRPLPGGQRPRCGATGGPPRPGNGDFAINLSNAPASALVALHAGYYYVPYVFPLALGVNLPFGTALEEHSMVMQVQAAAEGFGRCSRPLPIPAHPAMIGVSAYFTWTIFDQGWQEPLPIYVSDTLQVSVW